MYWILPAHIYQFALHDHNTEALQCCTRIDTAHAARLNVTPIDRRLYGVFRVLHSQMASYERTRRVFSAAALRAFQPHAWTYGQHSSRKRPTSGHLDRTNALCFHLCDFHLSSLACAWHDNSSHMQGTILPLEGWHLCLYHGVPGSSVETIHKHIASHRAHINALHVQVQYYLFIYFTRFLIFALDSSWKYAV